jgi:hypothetical protein
MARLSKTKIRKQFEAGDAATTGAERGRVLEQIIGEVFGNSWCSCSKIRRSQ